MDKKERLKLRLIAPSPEMRPQAENFVSEFRKNGEEKINGSRQLADFAGKDFNAWLERLKTTTGSAPSTTFFAISLPDGKIVGVTDIRHYVTEETYKWGHIGLSVRPSERRKGYGTEIMRLALQKAYEFGVLEAVVTCDRDNMASRKTIRRNDMRKNGEIVEESGNVIYTYSKELP